MIGKYGKQHFGEAAQEETVVKSTTYGSHYIRESTATIPQTPSYNNVQTSPRANRGIDPSQETFYKRFSASVPNPNIPPHSQHQVVGGIVSNHYIDNQGGAGQNSRLATHV